jgi:anti-sigma regulatory factor (Ser/Thr protein kinase)
VVVKDRGPGIPDIEQAMQPGWTTATPEVREMGFGAGLGLPNIRSNVDYLKILSEVGEGTVLEFAIMLE